MGRVWGRVSPAWNSCGCPCGALTGNPARPAGHTDTPCEENEEKGFEKEQGGEKEQAGDHAAACRQPELPQGGQPWFSAGSEGRGQRAEGTAILPREPGLSAQPPDPTRCGPCAQCCAEWGISLLILQTIIKPLLGMGKLALKEGK